ncbi:MAG: DUF2318 domain-containing protein, partial [Oscillospiraceae bacterium]|nr:DUF2318 domain-containing protein [Oscillospiraceae bacterium]
MLKYLIQVIASSLAAGLLVASVFTLASRNADSKRCVYGRLACGGAIGILAALVLAVLRHETKLINREQINIILLPALIIMGAVLIVLTLWSVRKVSPPIYPKVLGLAGGFFIALLFFYHLPDVFLYTTEFLAAGESIFSTDFLFKVIGYTAGLAVVCLTAVALFQSGTHLSEKTAGICFAVGLFVNILNEAAGLVQILLARRIIPMTDWLFRLIQPLINHSAFFLYAILLATLVIPAVLWILSWHPKDSFSNPAEHRKIKARSRRQRRWSVMVACGYIAAVLCLTVVKSYNEHEVVLSPAEPMDIVGAEIRIPLENVNDGRLHRFAYITEDGTEVRFIVIKKNESSYGVGL